MLGFVQIVIFVLEVWIYEFSDENYEQDNLLRDQHYLFSNYSINGKFAGFLCYENDFKENLYVQYFLLIALQTSFTPTARWLRLE